MDRSAPDPTPLWATKALLEEPDLMRVVHDDVLAAGPMVPTTNSHAIHHDKPIPAGVNGQVEALHGAAREIAGASRHAGVVR